MADGTGAKSQKQTALQRKLVEFPPVLLKVILGRSQQLFFEKMVHFTKWAREIMFEHFVNLKVLN